MSSADPVSPDTWTEMCIAVNAILSSPTIFNPSPLCDIAGVSISGTSQPPNQVQDE